MSGYTLKLDLSRYELGVLQQLLKSEIESAERDGRGVDNPFVSAVHRISEMTYGYRRAVEEANKITCTVDVAPQSLFGVTCGRLIQDGKCPVHGTNTVPNVHERA